MTVVAMTREMGADGVDVAARLADAMNSQVIQHEIIEPLADKMRLRKSHVVRLMEGKASALERLTADHTSMSIYTAEETVEMVGKQPHGTVIRTWGATHLLRPIPHIITVRVCSPMELRIQRIMKRLNTEDREFAEREIRMSDEAHAAIMKRHFNVEWSDASGYDLVLNTERVPVDECVNEIKSLLQERSFQETEFSRKAFADLSLEVRVAALLRSDKATAKYRIGVKAGAAEGTVSLFSKGATDEEIEMAVPVASKLATVIWTGFRGYHRLKV
jgi:cytidylate kinase